MSIAHYLLQVNIYLLVFYGFYKLLLERETYFTLNRFYLVSAGLLSLAIPFLRFEWFTRQEAIQPVYISVGQLMGQASIVEEAPAGFNLGNLIVAIYFVGFLFFSIKLIQRLLNVSSKLKQTGPGTAFSFLWKKSIDPNLPQLHTVHKHEDTHIRQCHSIDVLFFEILGIFTWFNPVIYFYKSAVKSIHEYLADEEAAKFQGNKEQYALLLLSSAFGVSVNTLTNSFFNKSLIKKRIFMLHKKRSPKIAVLKYGLFIPLFATALIMSSATVRSNEKIQEIADNIPLNTPVEAVTEAVKASIEPKDLSSIKKRETINVPSLITQAGWEEFYRFMRINLKYPTVAQKEQIQGTTMLKFTIVAGQIENVGIGTKLGGGCDAEAMKSLVSFSDYKSIKDGKYTLQVSFFLDGSKAPKLNTNITTPDGYTPLNKITVTAISETITVPGNSNDKKIYDFVSIDTQPMFPGGFDKFYSYLKHNLKYPAEAAKNKVHGKVFLSFIVEENGDLSAITVERKLGSGTDEEAVRVLKASPKWLPGTQGGKPVRVKYNIPITFNESNEQTPTETRQNKEDSTLPLGKNIGIRFKSNNGGEMKFGSKPENEPLYILDGKPIVAAEMNAIDPNNIESIHVLKDANATALYGLKGVNGVILITSKTGKVTEKVKEVKKEK